MLSLRLLTTSHISIVTAYIGVQVWGAGFLLYRTYLLTDVRLANLACLIAGLLLLNAVMVFSILWSFRSLLRMLITSADQR